MERLTVDTNLPFCDIAMCRETPGGSFCEDGYCDQRRVYEKLREYERTGLEPEGIVAAQNAMRSALALACEVQAYRNLGPIDCLRELGGEQDG